MRVATLVLAALCFLTGIPTIRAADFKPDPRTVKRQGAGYRYPQAGWIVLHIEGEPYERGYQHGYLMAPEIAGYVKCFANLQNSKAATEGWKTTRTLVNALFVRRFDPEYLHEMKGIADGAAAAGAKFDDRPVDLVDVVALNCWAELETLDAALEATPNGLEGIRFPRIKSKEMPTPKPMHCSAFAATGPATADGKIVFGHVTMFDLYPSLFFNVWLDIKPTRGHRMVMQSYPGGIQSGMDYYINDAGILVLETTIAQTRFDPKGLSLASRIRKAVQYGDSIDKAVELLAKENNGLYTNEWILADIKTNEIAMFELGTEKTKLYRSSKNEWFGDTPGFYWGCNNAKDIQVRLDTIASVKGKPANMVWKPADRDIKWQQLYGKYKGKIDGSFGKDAFATTPLCSAITIDAKYTTSEMAKEMKSWVLFGPPLGRSWKPTEDERSKFSDIRPLVSNPWTIVHTGAPAKTEASEPAVVDLPDKIEKDDSSKGEDSKQSILRTEDRTTPSEPAWHGTILPKADADIWLAIAFAEYEKIVAQEKTLREASDGKLTASDMEKLALEHFNCRSSYLAAARSRPETSLAKIRSETSQEEWYRTAAGKGVLVLHELRKLVGAKAFDELMDSFGKENAGKEVTTAQFMAHVEKTAGKSIDGFFDFWLNQTGLPSLELEKVVCTPQKMDGEKGYVITGKVVRKDGLPAGVVQITVETEKDEQTEKVTLLGPSTTFTIKLKDKPERVVLDKYGLTAKSNGLPFSVLAFTNDLDQTLIVYGTADEAAANRETAEALQEAIRTRWSNHMVPIKSDKDVKEEDLKGQHVLLVGRPSCNTITAKFERSLPVSFGPQSVVVRQDAYAHAGSGVIAAGENPLNKRYAVVVLAGLSAEATTKLPAILMKKDQQNAEVIVVPNGGSAKGLVIPSKELVAEVSVK